MLSGATLGQFCPKDSVIHKLDPRVKIISTLFFIVLTFLSTSYLSLATLFATLILTMLLSKISIKTYFKNIKIILFVVLFTAVMNLFYSSGEVIFQLGFLKLTSFGIHNSVFVALRFTLLVLSGSILTYATSPSELTYAIEKLLAPLSLFKLNTSNIAMMLTISLRFVPVLIEEIDKISNAQKARGSQLECGNLKQRAKALVPILVPLFVLSFKRATDLAVAMECRCYNCDQKRTHMKILKFTKNDIFAIIVLFSLLAAILKFNHYFQAVVL